MSSESSEQSAGGRAPGKKTGDVEPVVVGGWSEKVMIRRRQFPGPAGVRNEPRIAIARDAYADLTAHAKDSLDAEVCGVLVGNLCEDADGPFVSVEAIIRGAAARNASTHVTFTQETWTQIHQAKERDHPTRQIVGWYHTHPGFGVEFSEMDLFVHRNFFSGAGQIAFVTDPLGGREAILVNVGATVVPASRFWVDGRERLCHKAESPQAATGSDPAISASIEQALRSIDDRVSQLMQAVDTQSASIYRFLLSVGMVVAIGMLALIAYDVYYAYTHDNRPPELQSFVPVPVQVGDKAVMLGVGIVKWDVPPALNAAMVELERERQAAAVAATQPATAPAPGPATSPK